MNPDEAAEPDTSDEDLAWLRNVGENLTRELVSPREVEDGLRQIMDPANRASHQQKPTVHRHQVDPAAAHRSAEAAVKDFATGASRHLLFAVDVVGYSAHSASTQRQMQVGVEEVVDRTLRAANRGWARRSPTDRMDEVRKQSQGDALFVQLPAGIDEAATLADLIRGLKAELADLNQDVIPDARLRLRVAFATSVSHQLPLGLAESGLTTVGRLLDGAPLHDAMRQRPNAQLAVIVEDTLYRNVVLPRMRGLDPDQWVPANMRVNKAFTAKAWLAVPGFATDGDATSSLGRPAAAAASPIRVLLVDGHALLRRGLDIVLQQEPDIEVVGEVGDGAEAVERAAELLPDVVLLDVKMPKRGGIEAAAAIKEVAPSTRIVMLTVSDEEADLYDAIKAGATGYLLKEIPPHEIADSIRAVAGGQSLITPSMATKLLSEFATMARHGEERRDQAPPAPKLTDRELEVLKLIATGANNSKIAKTLFISENTVKNHVRNILEKLQLHSRMEAVMYAVREKILDLP